MYLQCPVLVLVEREPAELLRQPKKADGTHQTDREPVRRQAVPTAFQWLGLGHGRPRKDELNVPVSLPAGRQAGQARVWCTAARRPSRVGSAQLSPSAAGQSYCCK